MNRPLPAARVTFVAVTLVAVALVAACGSSTPSRSPSAGPASPSAASSSGASPSGASSPGTSAAPGTSPSSAASPGGSATLDPSAGASGSPGPSATPDVQYQSPSDLEIGDCYIPIQDSDTAALLAAVVVPCGEPHYAEVFATDTLPGAADAPYPGQDDLDRDSQEICDAAFGTYVGKPFRESALSYIYYTPTRATWAGGDRSLLCVIDDDGRPMTGSVKGSAR